MAKRGVLTQKQLTKFFGTGADAGLAPGDPTGASLEERPGMRAVLTPEQAEQFFGADSLGAFAGQPSAIESGLRGAAQTASLGFADEISGALESAFSDKTYQQARDESRSAYKKAREAHPYAYGAGEIGGGLASILIPGGALVKGAGLAGKIGMGAAVGGAAGLGTSEATDIGGIAKDTVTGAALGAGVAGAAAGLGAGLSRILGKSAPAAEEGAAMSAEPAMATAGAGAAPRPGVISGALGRFGDARKSDAREYAAEQIAKAQASGDAQQVAKVAQKYGPMLAGEDSAAATAAATSPEAAQQVSRKALAEGALDKLELGVTAGKKRKAYGTSSFAGTEKTKTQRELMGMFEEDPELAVAVSKNGASGFNATMKRMEPSTQRLDEIYDTVQAHEPGANLVAVDDALKAIEQRYRSQGLTRKLADQVQAARRDMMAAYGEVAPGEDALIPWQSLREEVSTAATRGYGNGGQLSNSESKTLQRDIASALRGSLHSEMERVAARAPELEGIVPELQALNKKTSLLYRLRDLTEDKAVHDTSHSPTMGEMLSKISSPLEHVKEGLHALKEGNAKDLAKSAWRAGSGVISNKGMGVNATLVASKARAAALAGLVQAKRTGATGAVLASARQGAVDAGVPAAVVSQIMGE